MKDKENAPQPYPLSSEPEVSLATRELGFRQIVGQSGVIQRLAELSELHRRSGQVLGHMLLLGAEGSGKRTIAHALAREHSVSIRTFQAADIERAGDLAAIISGFEIGDIFLLANVNRMRKALVGLLCDAMKTFELSITVGKGSGARSMPLEVKRFTCIGTAERESDCAPELVRSFHIEIPLQRYSDPEIEKLTERLASQADLSIDVAATNLVAKLADGTPGRAELMLQKLKMLGKAPISEVEARRILSAYGYGSSTPRPLNGVTANVASLSGVEFERLVVTLLKNLGFSAEMTKATGDGGIDIEAVLDRPIVGGRYLIQCKRFAAETLVGSPTVREFYGALVADRRAVKGILITTSDFSAQAREFARALPVELICGADLAKMLAEMSREE